MKGKLFNEKTKYFQNIEFGNIEELYKRIRASNTLHYVNGLKGKNGKIIKCTNPALFKGRFGVSIKHFNELRITKNTLRILNKDESFEPGQPRNSYIMMSVFDDKGLLINFDGVNIRNSNGNLFKTTRGNSKSD